MGVVSKTTLAIRTCLKYIKYVVLSWNISNCFIETAMTSFLNCIVTTFRRAASNLVATGSNWSSFPGLIGRHGLALHDK
jgi:hypothetical protein